MLFEKKKILLVDQKTCAEAAFAPYESLAFLKNIS